MSGLIDPILGRALVAGFGIALAAGPLGSLVVWRRMAYFGDATAHAAVLGVALALSLEISVFLGTLCMALAMGLSVSALTDRTRSMDTSLGVLSHGALAAGMVAVSLMTGVRIDIQSLLFGEILLVQPEDLQVIWSGAALVAGVLWWRWSNLVTATLSPELARAAGIDPRAEQLILTATLAVTIAVSIKVVGVLLITALLIMPAAAARPFSRTPEAMVIVATGIAALAVAIGLAASWRFDLLAGPAIVCAAGALFLISMFWRGRRTV